MVRRYPTTPLDDDDDAGEPLTLDEVTILAFVGMVTLTIFCLLVWAVWKGGEDLLVLL
jgi:hypothetical protein